MVAANVDEPECSKKIDGTGFCARSQNKNIQFVRNQGLLVENDNDYALENMPQAQVSFSCHFDGESWSVLALIGE